MGPRRAGRLPFEFLSFEFQLCGLELRVSQLLLGDVSRHTARNDSDCTYRYNARIFAPEESSLSNVRARAAAGLFGFAAVQYLVGEALTASKYDGYSYLRQTVSELGVSGQSPWHDVVNTSFCLSAVSVAAAGALSASLLRGRRNRVYLGSVAAYSTGCVLIAVVPAGDGAVHVVGAVLSIAAGNVIAVTVGTGVHSCPRWYRTASTALGVAGLAVSALLVAGIGPIGAVERAPIYTFVAWELMTAVALLRSARSKVTG
ncbi:MAG: hypothetical protein ACJA07_000802 [Rhodococcus sp. (in: high G+C Gram-positive bacteria)]|nr:DUF998 domain-containing protein [Rhodococcus sp. I2R]